MIQTFTQFFLKFTHFHSNLFSKSPCPVSCYVVLRIPLKSDLIIQVSQTPLSIRLPPAPQVSYLKQWKNLASLAHLLILHFCSILARTTMKHFDLYALKFNLQAWVLKLASLCLNLLKRFNFETAAALYFMKFKPSHVPFTPYWI